MVLTWPCRERVIEADSDVKATYGISQCQVYMLIEGLVEKMVPVLFNYNKIINLHALMVIGASTFCPKTFGVCARSGQICSQVKNL